MQTKKNKTTNVSTIVETRKHQDMHTQFMVAKKTADTDDKFKSLMETNKQWRYFQITWARLYFCRLNTQCRLILIFEVKNNAQLKKKAAKSYIMHNVTTGETIITVP